MRIRAALLLAILSLLGCGAERERAPVDESRLLARVDSINATTRKWQQTLAAAVLQEPPDYVGRIIDIADVGTSGRRVVVRYEPLPWQPAVGQRRLSFVVAGEWMAWSQEGNPLPARSLQIGDAVKIWVDRGVTSQPVDPPPMAFRAIQRIDSLPPAAQPLRPAA